MEPLTGVSVNVCVVVLVVFAPERGSNVIFESSFVTANSSNKISVT
jgi:hypothetical protein